jgi:hypothetical protein
MMLTLTAANTPGKHLAAAIYDDGADNIGKPRPRGLFSAYFWITSGFLLVSAANAGFGDVDFRQ